MSFSKLTLNAELLLHVSNLYFCQGSDVFNCVHFFIGWLVGLPAGVYKKTQNGFP